MPGFYYAFITLPLLFSLQTLLFPQIFRLICQKRCNRLRILDGSIKNLFFQFFQCVGFHIHILIFIQILSGRNQILGNIDFNPLITKSNGCAKRKDPLQFFTTVTRLLLQLCLLYTSFHSCIYFINGNVSFNNCC